MMVTLADGGGFGSNSSGGEGGSGSSTGGGHGSSTSTSGGPPHMCTGCFDVNGQCAAGTSDMQCGSNTTCQDCTAFHQTCQQQVCGGGGGGSGSGSSGGGSHDSGTD
jgi:hypothetical protein